MRRAVGRWKLDRTQLRAAQEQQDSDRTQLRAAKEQQDTEKRRIQGPKKQLKLRKSAPAGEDREDLRSIDDRNDMNNGVTSGTNSVLLPAAEAVSSRGIDTPQETHPDPHLRSNDNLRENRESSSNGHHVLEEELQVPLTAGKPRQRPEPARAYQSGETIIVENKEGEVLKKYDIPDRFPEDEDQTRSTMEPPSGQRTAEVRLGSNPSRSDIQTTAKGLYRDLAESWNHSQEDEHQVHFTIRDGGRRMTEDEFIQELSKIDPKGRPKFLDGAKQDIPNSFQKVENQTSSTTKPPMGRGRKVRFAQVEVPIKNLCRTITESQKHKHQIRFTVESSGKSTTAVNLVEEMSKIDSEAEKRFLGPKYHDISGSPPEPGSDNHQHMPRQSLTSAEDLEKLIQDSSVQRVAKLLKDFDKKLAAHKSSTSSILNHPEDLPSPSFIPENTRMEKTEFIEEMSKLDGMERDNFLDALDQDIAFNASRRASETKAPKQMPNIDANANANLEKDTGNVNDDVSEQGWEAEINADIFADIFDGSEDNHLDDRTANNSFIDYDYSNPPFTEQSNDPFVPIHPRHAATHGPRVSWPVAGRSSLQDEQRTKNSKQGSTTDFGLGNIEGRYSGEVKATKWPEVPGTVDDVPVDALPDWGSTIDAVSEDFAMRHKMMMKSTDNHSIRLLGGHFAQCIGRAVGLFKFKGETDAHRREFHVLRDSAYDVVLGRHFLSQTKTLTEFCHRIVMRLRPCVERGGRLFLMDESPGDRLRCAVNGIQASALPDTGSEFMIVSGEFARRHKFNIRREKEFRRRVELINGSTMYTDGMVLDAVLQFDAPPNSSLGIGVDEYSEFTAGLGSSSRCGTNSAKATFVCDLHVVEDLPCDIILSGEFIVEHKIFSRFESLFYAQPTASSERNFLEDSLLFISRFRPWRQSQRRLPNEIPLQSNSSWEDDWASEELRRNKEQLRIGLLDEHQRPQEQEIEDQRRAEWDITHPRPSSVGLQTQLQPQTQPLAVPPRPVVAAHFPQIQGARPRPCSTVPPRRPVGALS